MSVVWSVLSIDLFNFRCIHHIVLTFECDPLVSGLFLESFKTNKTIIYFILIQTNSESG